MTLKQSYEMDFQHCYKLWRVLNGREGMSLKSSWKSWTGLCTGLDWTGLDWTASLNTEWPLYSKMTTRTIIDLKYFSRNRKKMTPRKASFYLFFLFSPKKFARLFLSNEVTPSPDCKMIKLTTFDTPVTYFCHYDILAKTRSRMTRLSRFPTKMTLVHSRALLSQYYWGNLLLVVVLVLESKGL